MVLHPRSSAQRRKFVPSATLVRHGSGRSTTKESSRRKESLIRLTRAWLSSSALCYRVIVGDVLREGPNERTASDRRLPRPLARFNDECPSEVASVLKCTLKKY